MAELMFQNLGEAIQKGYEIGTANRVQRETEMRQNQLRDLASQAYAAPSGQRSGIIQQAVSVDPEAGFALGDKLEEREVNQSKRAGNVADYMLRAFESKNPAQIQGAYQAVKPYFQGIAPDRPLPDQADESMLPMLYQMKAAAAGIADAVPTGFAEFDMKARAAGLTPGSPEYKEAANIALGRVGRAASGGFGFTEFTGPDGRKRIQRNNPRTGAVEVYDETSGEFAPVGGKTAAASTSQPTNFGGLLSSVPGLRVTSTMRTPEQNEAAGGVPNSFHLTGEAIDLGRPTPEQRKAIDQWAAQNGFEVISNYQDGHVHLEPRGRSPAVSRSPVLGASRSPEEQAALTTAAEEAARLDAYRNATSAYADREAATTTARESAERMVESASALPQVIAAADETTSLLDRVLNHPGREAATGSSSLNPLNRIPGTDAYDFNVLLDQIKGQAFLQAFQSLRGGGAITEREGQAATNAIARLNAAQSEGEFTNAINDLKRIVRQGRDRAVQKASTSQPSTSQSASGWSIQRID